MARVAQGLGAAILLPASLAILSHTFPNVEERSRAVAVWANTAGLGFAASPVLGGLLTAWLGWRTIFWLNVPVGIAALWFNPSVLNSARQVGGTVGVALLGTVMESFPTTIGFACATGLTVVVLIATAHVTGRTLPAPCPSAQSR